MTDHLPETPDDALPPAPPTADWRVLGASGGVLGGLPEPTPYAPPAPVAAPVAPTTGVPPIEPPATGPSAEIPLAPLRAPVASAGGPPTADPAAPTADPTELPTPRPRRKWHKALALSGALLLAWNAIPSLTPEHDVPRAPTTITAQFAIVPSGQRVANPVETKFTSALTRTTRSLRALYGGADSGAIARTTVCELTPSSLTRLSAQMESHQYRYGLAAARALVLAQCADYMGLSILYDELDAWRYTGLPAHAAPVEVHVLRERVARTLAVHAQRTGDSAGYLRWNRAAQRHAAAREGTTYAALPDPDRESTDQYRLHVAYQEELGKALDRYGEGARPVAGLTKVVGAIVR